MNERWEEIILEIPLATVHMPNDELYRANARIKWLAKRVAEMETLLREVAQVYEAEEGGQALLSQQGQGMDGISAYYNYREVAKAISSALKEKTDER